MFFRAKLKEKTFSLGVDIGGTKISSALFSPDAHMLYKKKIPIRKSEPEEPVRQIIESILDLEALARKNGDAISAVGIVIPGVVFHQKGMVWAPNIPGWDNFLLRDKLEEEVDLPLILDNDRSAYVLGEQWCGVARNKRHVVFLAVGTGIGAGIIIDGRLCRGSEDIAGAVGWFALNPDYKEEYAQMGCFEAEASGDSVARRARRLLYSGEPSKLEEMVKGQLKNITAETVVEAAKSKDPLSQRVINETVQYLAMGIANIVSILNPEIVVLGGGLFQAGQFLLNPVKKEFRRWAQPLAAQKVIIELSQLGEDAGLYGAGKLAWQHNEIHI